MGIFTEFFTDKFSTAKHIAPLVVTAELHITTVFFVEIVEVVTLHNHIVEFEETKTLFHTLFVTFRTKHIVNGETSANFTKKFNVVKVKEPFCVVNHLCFAFAEFNKSFHLAFETLSVVVNIFFCKHFSHIGSARGVTNHSSTAADKCNRLVACHLKTFHKSKRHKVTCSKAVSSTVETDVEICFTAIYHLTDFAFICNLRNKTASD